MIAPEPVYPSDPTDALADLRMLLDRCPEAVFAEPSDLARLLRCTEAEIEAARAWLLADGLEVRA